MNEPVEVVERFPTLAEKAIELLQQSLNRSEQLLIDGHYREAVQETLWVLESVTTSFKNIETSGTKIRGSYFNDIVRELRKLSKRSTLDRVLDWMTKLHGYLSSPSGGGVRHGIDLNNGIPLGETEAKLFCNLIRSYTGYLLSEYEHLKLNQS